MPRIGRPRWDHQVGSRLRRQQLCQARTLAAMGLRRWLVRLAIVACCLPRWVVVISPLVLAVSEGAVPSVADLDVPAGASILGAEKNCGSGGCWIEVGLQPAAGRTDSDLEKDLGLLGGERCQSSGLPMFWTICRLLGGDYPHHGVEASLYYRR